ncbi:MAG: hypothetical protein IJ772_00470 [Bacilli bacterium]|nr:hypothetical protein [Bacilli bacterium]MBR1817302.1 hypothetical protein [Bacilli bacterium]
MNNSQEKILESAKNEVIDGILRFFGKDTIGQIGDMLLNEMKWNSVLNLIPEKDLGIILQKIQGQSEENITQDSLNSIKGYLLPRIISKILPTKEKKEHSTSYEDEKEESVRDEYASFLHKGFTEYLSLEYARKNNLFYDIPKNHQENWKFAQEVILEMSNLPKEYSSQINKSLFIYNINQLEMQLSSLGSKSNFYKEFKSRYLYKEKLQQIKNLIQEDFNEEEQGEILKEIKSLKTGEHAILYLKKIYLEKYKEQLPLAEERIKKINEVLRENNTSTSQSKTNGNTRVLAKAGSIKGLFIFVFSVLFALVLAYFIAR